MPNFNLGMLCKIGGLALTVLASVLTGIADKKHTEAYLAKLVEDKLANKN